MLSLNGCHYSAQTSLQTKGLKTPYGLADDLDIQRNTDIQTGTGGLDGLHK